MEKHYETVCIVKPDVGEDVTKGVVKKATDALEAGKGKLNKLDEWGRRRLAYPIAKKSEGYYFVMDYTSVPAVSKEIERLLKLNENVIRLQTVAIIETKASVKAALAAVAPAPAAEQGAEGGQNG
ncbi:MAG: 30S ribosomal protein S6 [Deltaproteobacteria bacterium]|nr:30S ribosomal protein S6 [Deltaproteobacteria bacterium]